MKKIGVYLEAGPACGGVYQYSRFIVDALKEISNQYQIIAIYGDVAWAPYLQQKQIKSRFIKNTLLPRLTISLWRRLKLSLHIWRKISHYIHPLARAMKNENCDLWIFPSQDAFAYWMPVKSLATIHDLMHRYQNRFPEVGSKIESANRDFHYKNTCEYAAGILVDSSLGKNHVMESYQVNSEKCHVLPYIANRELRDMKSANFSVKYKLPLKFLFYPAQFWMHKNHINLIKAISLCKAELPDIQLVLVGSKKNGFNQVVELIKELKLNDCIHLLGLVDTEDVPELYRLARALVMPTYFGPTNIPPLEAWELDCPVAVSDIFGMREQLKEAATYFNPESVNDIADTIKKIWLDDLFCKKLIEAGRVRREELNFKNFTNTFLGILNKVLVNNLENVIDNKIKNGTIL